MVRYLSIFCLAFALILSCPAEPIQVEVQTALTQGQDAWNRGDLDTFLKGYVQGPEMTYTASGRVVRGIDELRARYQKAYGNSRETMGQLRFEEIQVWPLGDGYALAMGKWSVDFGARSKEPKSGGIFSLVLRKAPEGWLILHDHTSRLQDEKTKGNS
jgi:ketosteroid isomerase-like protein